MSLRTFNRRESLLQCAVTGTFSIPFIAPSTDARPRNAAASGICLPLSLNRRGYERREG